MKSTRLRINSSVCRSTGLSFSEEICLLSVKSSRFWSSIKVVHRESLGIRKYVILSQCILGRYNTYHSALPEIVIYKASLYLVDFSPGICNSSVVKHSLRREYVHSVVVYQKCLTRLGELIIYEPTKLDLFDIRQHYYTYSICLSMSFIV